MYATYNLAITQLDESTSNINLFITITNFRAEGNNKHDAGTTKVGRIPEPIACPLHPPIDPTKHSTTHLACPSTERFQVVVLNIFRALRVSLQTQPFSGPPCRGVSGRVLPSGGITEPATPGR